MSKKRPRGGSAATLPETTPTVEPPTVETLSDETREFLASLPPEVRASISAEELAEWDREPTAEEIEAESQRQSNRFLADMLRSRARRTAETYRVNWVYEYLSADALAVTAEMLRHFSRVAHRLHYERDDHDREAFPACRAAVGDLFAAAAGKLQAAARTAGEVAKYVEWEQAAYRVLAELKWPKYTVPNPVDPLRAIQATGPADLTPGEWVALRDFEQEQNDRLAAFERRLAEFISANRYFQLVFQESPIRLTPDELGCEAQQRSSQTIAVIPKNGGKLRKSSPGRPRTVSDDPTEQRILELIAEGASARTIETSCKELIAAYLTVNPIKANGRRNSANAIIKKLREVHRRKAGTK